ncbi:MAG: 50S ribosomal protein L19 [Planctomycetota bacterium]|jgi:large subunit ribosomal protein L19
METVDKLVAPASEKELPDFQEGDTVDVSVQIREGDKTRTQIFSGTVIRIKGSGIRRSFTVRRIVQGEGVERTFPVYTPTLIGMNIKKKGKVRRAKLYYLRDRVGKGTRVKERIWTGKKAKTPAKKASEVKAPATEAPAEEKTQEGS